MSTTTADELITRELAGRTSVTLAEVAALAAKLRALRLATAWQNATIDELLGIVPRQEAAR